jgi:hypothetical protein
MKKVQECFFNLYPCLIRKTALYLPSNMVDVAQSVRVVVCGTIGRGFESHLPPNLE